MKIRTCVTAVSRAYRGVSSLGHCSFAVGAVQTACPNLAYPRGAETRRDPPRPLLTTSDMLHVDIGITAMGMNTDTQHLGYILRANETSPPRSLVRGLHRANRMQDMNRREMVPGRTGDEVFFAVKRAMKAEGLQGDVYSHPIGDYGHSAGAVIGMANWQDCEWLSARVFLRPQTRAPFSLPHRLAYCTSTPMSSATRMLQHHTLHLRGCTYRRLHSRIHTRADQ